jgi:hypothetical protein
MARLRSKSYRESADAPVTSTPSAGAELPPVAEAKPAEPIVVESAVKQAEQSALRARLREMENAEGITRAALSQQQPLATEQPLPTEPIAIEQEPEQQPLTVEQIIEGSGLPERAQRWLRQHTDYVLDPVKNARIQKLHHVAEYQAGSEYTDMYFERLETLLGLKPETNGNGAQQPTQPAVQRQPVRQSAPVRQQGAVPVSAPPHRDVPSFSTGRSQNVRRPLTEAQREMARASGISEQEYATQLEKMERMKAAGAIQDGGQ